jgi:mono/diheme cytochrome c family protein
MKGSAHVSMICTVVAAVFFAGLALDAAAAKKKKIDGKEMFKANCKVCHEKGADAGEYTPMTLISEQWERFFDKKYENAHKDLKMPAGSDAEGQGVTEAITPEILEAIRKFSIKHAADSEHPMTCG